MTERETEIERKRERERGGERKLNRCKERGECR